MNDRELYQQKKQAQLDVLRAEADKLKARASIASADAQLEINRNIRNLENKFEESRLKLAELAKSGEDTWESVKAGVEAAWDSLKSGMSDAAAKFNQ